MRCISRCHKKNQHEPTKEQVKDVVHESLESRRRVCQAKWHDKKLKQTLMSPEGCFIDVVLVHPHLVIALMQVKLREEDRVAQLVDEFFDHRYRKFILGHLGVQCTVVAAEPP
jgi:hypothetical protein